MAADAIVNPALQDVSGAARTGRGESGCDGYVDYHDGKHDYEMMLMNVVVVIVMMI